MNLPQVEADQLFELKKYQTDGIIVNFPIQGEDIIIELQNDTGRIKFIAYIPIMAAISFLAIYSILI